MQVRGHVGSRTAPHRTARQGHEAYRKVAQALGPSVTEVCPWLAEHLRADYAAYPFARH